MAADGDGIAQLWMMTMMMKSETIFIRNDAHNIRSDDDGGADGGNEYLKYSSRQFRSTFLSFLFKFQSTPILLLPPGIERTLVPASSSLGLISSVYLFNSTRLDSPRVVTAAERNEKRCAHRQLEFSFNQQDDAATARWRRVRCRRHRRHRQANTKWLKTATVRTSAIDLDKKKTRSSQYRLDQPRQDYDWCDLVIKAHPRRTAWEGGRERWR